MNEADDLLDPFSVIPLSQSTLHPHLPSENKMDGWQNYKRRVSGPFGPQNDSPQEMHFALCIWVLSKGRILSLNSHILQSR